MGHLDDPLNTFWQLLALVKGSDRWVLATPAGVASNGGLAVSVAGGSLLAGFGPSQDLHFSPLAESTDGGRSWSPGLLPGQLAPVPNSLSVSTSGASTGGHPFALVQAAAARSSPAPVICPSGSRWPRSDVGRRSLDLLVRDREADRRRLRRRRWRLAPSWSARPAPTGPARHLRIRRPRLASGRAGAARGTAGADRGHPAPGDPRRGRRVGRRGPGKGAELFAVWSTDGLRTWSVSAGLPLDRGVLTATGTTPTGGFVVTTAADGRPGASEIDRRPRVARPGPAASGHVVRGRHARGRHRRPGRLAVGARRLHAGRRRMGSDPGAGRAHPVRIVRMTFTPVRASTVAPGTLRPRLRSTNLGLRHRELVVRSLPHRGGRPRRRPRNRAGPSPTPVGGGADPAPPASLPGLLRRPRRTAHRHRLAHRLLGRATTSSCT